VALEHNAIGKPKNHLIPKKHQRAFERYCSPDYTLAVEESSNVQWYNANANFYPLYPSIHPLKNGPSQRKTTRERTQNSIMQ